MPTLMEEIRDIISELSKIVAIRPEMLSGESSYGTTKALADEAERCLREYERKLAMSDQSQSTIRLDRSGGELKMLRDVVIRAHQMTGRNYVQSAEVMRDRTHSLLDAAIEASPVMRGFLGRGGPEAHRDILSGTGDLS